MDNNINWKIPPSKIVLSQHETHIWCTITDLPSNNINFLKSILSPDELDRASQFCFKRDKTKCIISRGLLRLVLSNYLSTEPNKIIFRYNQCGKPNLDDFNENEKLCFNVSHSANKVIYAFAYNSEVGIDIENIRHLSTADRLVERYFSELEKSIYFSLPLNLRNKAFFTCWTRKEAYIKARGEGLCFPLDHFSVSFTSEVPAKLLDVKGSRNELKRWHLKEILSDDEFVAALAIEGCSINYSYFKWSL